MVKSALLAPITSLQDVLVAEENETTFSLSHPKHVPLFASPLETAKHDYQAAHPDISSKHAQHAVQGLHGDVSPPSSHYEKHDQHDDPYEPKLKRAHEASVIQLFYDLFFVANLTTFTKVHEINDSETLSSYIGFFSILWFTWLQVTLFDVRFSNDSAFERLCKALQFGVMVGFAVVGPGYSVERASGSLDNQSSTIPLLGKKQIQTFQTLSLILMVSRLILAGQYLGALWWTKDYKKARLPLMAHIGTLFTTAMIFLGLYFAFPGKNGNRIPDVWYVMIGVEALVILFVSGRAKFLSLRRTCLVERLGLLTLIILGEGIIVLTSSVKNVRTSNGFPPDVIGNIICAVVIIYFLWMLYFDQIETERVGTIRQQIWTVAHFPFHICIILVVEGQRQLSTWRKVLDLAGPYFNELYAASSTSQVNETFNTLYEQFYDSEVPKPNITQWLAELDAGGLFNGTATGEVSNEVVDAVGQILSSGFSYIAQNFGTEVPKEVKKTGDKVEELNAIYNVFTTVFLYFFIGAGLALILLASLFWLGKRRKSRGEYLSIGLRLLVGLGLALLSTMYVSLDQDESKRQDRYLNYFGSAWMLPTVVLALNSHRP